MRKLSLVLGLLLLPAMAGAQTVTIDLLGDLDATAGYNLVSSIDGSGFAPGSQFILWSVINTDTNLDGIEYKLHVNGDADNNKFDLVGYALGPLSGFGAVFNGLGDAFDLFNGGPPFGWATTDYTKKALGTSLDVLAGSEAIFNNSAAVSAANVNGDTVIGYVLQANANFIPGVYEFSALGSIGGAPTAEWTNTPATGQILAGESFILTPEPTSALLLLAAVPFLRRRRA